MWLNKIVWLKVQNICWNNKTILLKSFNSSEISEDLEYLKLFEFSSIIWKFSILYWKLLTHICNGKFSILLYDIFHTCLWFFPFLCIIFPILAYGNTRVYGKFPSTNDKSPNVYGAFKSMEEKPYFRRGYLRLFFTVKPVWKNFLAI